MLITIFSSIILGVVQSKPDDINKGNFLESPSSQIETKLECLSQNVENLCAKVAQIEKEIINEQQSKCISDSDNFVKTFKESEEITVSKDNLNLIQSNVDSMKHEINKLTKLLDSLIEEKNSLNAKLNEITLHLNNFALPETRQQMPLIHKENDHKQTIESDFSKKILNLFNKLNEKNESLHKTVEELENLMGDKMTKDEILPLIEHVQKSLQKFQDTLNINEAAGAHSKTIQQNINCISCDKDVVMQINQQQVPKFPSFSPSKPFLASRLKLIRKQGATNDDFNSNFYQESLKRDNLLHESFTGNHLHSNESQLTINGNCIRPCCKICKCSNYI